MVQGSGFEVQGVRFRVQGVGLRVCDSGVRGGGVGIIETLNPTPS